MQARRDARTGGRPLDDLLAFAEIWAVDFEFGAKPGENPEPVCLVAWELRSGRKLRLWRDEFGCEPPYTTGPDVLFVAYYASAEIGCHLALGWPVPERVLDPFTEFRNHTTASPRSVARAYLARWPTMVWTASAPSRKTKCAT
jgi:DNA polymerase-1